MGVREPFQARLPRGRVEAPATRIRIGACEVHLLGTIAGFVPEATRVQAAFAVGPEAVALGVPQEDLPALEALWKDPALQQELVEPDVANEHLLKLLGRFGATRIPSPDLEAAYSLAKEANIPVEALDLDDTEHATTYVERVKVRHLWWAPRREKRLLKENFEECGDAYALAIAWDREVNASKPIRELETLRENRMAARIRELAGKHGRLLAIVPAPRFAGIASRLQPVPPAGRP